MAPSGRNACFVHRVCPLLPGWPHRSSGKTTRMSDTVSKALLPAGLRDFLPPDAALEAHVVSGLMADFGAHGYERVKPPLIEFEENLLDGAGAATSKDTFRMMDPVSQRMMGLRADMTIQVARIATTRLSKAPRPLRLCYSGQVLRVKGTQLNPERQFTQAGLELIGSDSPAADAEVMALTAGALTALGVQGVSVDLNLPTLVPVLCDEMELSPETQLRLRAALDQKDAAAVREMGGPIQDLFGELIRCSGEVDTVLDRLGQIDLPQAAAQRRDRLKTVVALVRRLMPGLSLTVDAVENRGFEYHTGISFSIFAPGARGELARGGRYRAGSAKEKAVGCTVYVDTVMGVIAPPADRPRLLLPYGDRAQAAAWQSKGWVTVAMLEDGVADPEAEACRQRCTHYVSNGQVRAVGG